MGRLRIGHREEDGGSPKSPADGVQLLGGSGNDKILLYSDITTDATIDGGAGNDIIVGYNIENSKIVMNDGNYSLTSTYLYKDTIESSYDDIIKTNYLNTIWLISNKCIFGMDIGHILESAVSIDNAKEFSIVITGSDNDLITSKNIYNSTLNTCGGDDTIKVNMNMTGSTIKARKGNDTIYNM